MVEKKNESIFEFRMGPAFFAVLFSICISLAQFAYSQGQQSNINDNTKKVTEKLEQILEKQDNRLNSQTERLVKVETIAGTIQSSIATIDAKLDRLAVPSKLDKN